MTKSADKSKYVADTYLLTSVAGFVDSVTYRLLADGLILQDLEQAKEEVSDWSDWGAFWIRRAQYHEHLADQSLANGHRLTAGNHLARASLCAHAGQFLYFRFPEVKRKAAELKVELFQRAAQLLNPPFQRLDIPFSLCPLPAYLRLPQGTGPFPCVVQVGGLDAAKEDSFGFADLLVDRGIASLAFDGPGQGETFYSGFRLGQGWPEALSAVVDWLENHPRIASQRIGMIGRSTGGFLAPRAAADEPRIKALVVWGAMYDLGIYDQIPPLVREGFQFITGRLIDEPDPRPPAFIDLQGHAQRIRCPMYVIHGGRDNITPTYNADRLVAEAAGPVKYDLFQDSIHCVHDVAHIARPAMADWLAEALAASP